jgi:CheY-like chemotaxis protein
MNAASRHRCTVLVVDDDRELQEVLRFALPDLGFSTAFADTGRDALDYLRSHVDVCMILLDLMLPGMDGARFRAIQMRDRSIAWIPVIVMSGAIDAASRAAAIRAAGLVRKPLDLDELRSALEALSKSRCLNGLAPDELDAHARGPLSSA